ncbi:MAG: urease accessory protein UreE [Casimicrobiaceae bacterium]|nr:urease accessory protein UreE [Casimicrobiaceae bacterium]MCX8098705.1 urease accessory protein UreE [Casimicrobiaceae bacterium]MDW8312144.1 urease accessory protein UreE [Burkholderiales bacterium]
MSMPVATERLPPAAHPPAVDAVVRLSFAQREKSRLRTRLASGEEIGLMLKPGTVLADGDCLRLDDGRVVRVEALPESLLEVRAPDPVTLLRIAYHIGNRHVPLAVAADHLLILPDHVLRAMVESLGGTVSEVTRAFQPETGAYGHSHVHHAHDDLGHGGRIHDGLSPRTQDR